MRLARYQCRREREGGSEAAGPQDGGTHTGPVRTPFPDDLDAVASAFDTAAQATADELRTMSTLKVVGVDGI